MRSLKIAKDFHRCPGGRRRADGKHSAQEFLEEVLEPLFVASQEPIEIDLDGGAGYAASFLEEAFGGLARRFGKRVVSERLSFVSEDQPYLIPDIESYIDDVDDDDHALLEMFSLLGKKDIRLLIVYLSELCFEHDARKTLEVTKKLQDVQLQALVMKLYHVEGSLYKGGYFKTEGE